MQHMAMAVDTYTSVEQIAGEWDDLAKRTGASPFLRPGWIAAWARAFGGGKLEVHALRRGGKLAGVLPVQRRAGGVHAPANWHTPEWGPVAEDDAAARELFDAVFAARPPYALLRFLGPGTEEAVGAARAAGYAATARPLQQSPYIELGGGWDSLAQPRAKSVAKTKQKLGDVEFEWWDRLDGLLDDVLVLEGSGWKVELGTAIVSQPRLRSFYEEVMRWADAAGILRIAFLRVGERRIAVEFGFQDDRRFYNVKGGYDPEFKKHSPGIVIAHDLIKMCADQGLETFEYLGAAEPMKMEWTDLTRDVVSLEAFSPRPLGQLAHASYVHGRPLAKRGLALLKRAGGRGARDAA